jgi:hypothetical protein
MSEKSSDTEIQEAIDLVSFGKTASVHCGNCGVYRTVGNDDTFPYLVERCKNCGDDEYDLLDERDIP